MKTKTIAVLVILLLAVLSVFVTACGASEEERKKEFLNWYSEVKPAELTEEERKAEFLNWYNKLNPAELTEEEIKEEVLGRVRAASTEVAFVRPLEEVFRGLNIVEKINSLRADEATQENPLTIEEILADEELRQEGISMLPSGAEAFENGQVYIPSPPYLFGFDTPTIPINLGIFTKDSVILPSINYSAICYRIKTESAGSFIVTSTLLANSKLEDSWKREILFDGTARELCAGKGEHSPKIDEDKGIAVFKRPSTKSLQARQEPLLVGSADELELGDKLYFARNEGNGKLELGIALFDGTVKNIEGAKVIRFSGRFDPESDGGAVLYYVDGNNKLKAVAVTSPLGAFAIELKFLLESIDDLLYILPEINKAED